MNYASKEMMEIKSKDHWKYLSIGSWLFSLISVIMTYKSTKFTLFDTFFFARDDGWCNTEKEAFFAHCFGDFHQGVMPNSLEDPGTMDEKTMILSPADKLIWQTGNLVYKLIGARPTLALFLAIYIICVTFGWILISRIAGENIWVMIFFLTSLPSLYAILRMNNICLLFPLFVLYLDAVLKDNHRKQIVLLATIVIFKPHLIILIGLDFMNGRHKVALSKLISSAITFASILVFEYGLKVSTFVDYAKNIFAYGSDRSTPLTFYPLNISLSHSLGTVYNLLGFYITEDRLTKVVVIISIIAIGMTFALRKTLATLESIFLYLFFVLTGLSVYAQPYYLILIVAIGLVLLIKLPKSKHRKLLTLGLLISSSYSIIPFAVDGKSLIYNYQFPEYYQTVVANIMPPVSVSLLFLFAALLLIDQMKQSILQR